MPNNAVLVVAGDFKTEEAKQWIQNTLVVSKGPTEKDKLL
jgi:predicted Zn-dependent peptidase